MSHIFGTQPQVPVGEADRESVLSPVPAVRVEVVSAVTLTVRDHAQSTATYSRLGIPAQGSIPNSEFDGVILHTRRPTQRFRTTVTEVDAKQLEIE